jgi:hypothetical protein
MPPLSPIKRPYLAATILSLAISLLIVSPFFRLGSASGHDFEFHVASWLEVANQWHQGTFFPRWAEWPNHGFGEPRFIFYPPLSWLLAPALSFFVSWNNVPVLFIVLVQTFAGLSAFALARKLLPDRGALFAAACYAANPNALLIIYMRSDFAELLASAFFPLLFAAALRLAGLLDFDDEKPVHQRGVIAIFAATFAAVWLSNAPAGVLVTYGIAVLFAWAALAQRSWRPLARGAAGVALGFGLAAFYIVPAAYEQRWVNISQVLSSGLLPDQNFLYTIINDPEHNLFNWIASTAAIALIVLTGLASLAVLRHARSGDLSQDSSTADSPSLSRAFLVLAAVATLMMLRPSSLLWEFLPKLRFVQFPWRWMSILALPFAYFMGATVAQPFLAVRQPKQSRRLIPSLWIASVSGILLAAGIFFVRSTWWDADDIPSLQYVLKTGDGFEGTDEYDPIGDDHYNLPPKALQAVLLPPLDSPAGAAAPLATSLNILRWTAEDRIVRLKSPSPARLALRILNYPAWRIELNGTVVHAAPPTDNNQMILAVPDGESTVRVTFTRTSDRTGGILLSVAAALVALALLSRKRTTSS